MVITDKPQGPLLDDGDKNWMWKQYDELSTSGTVSPTLQTVEPAQEMFDDTSNIVEPTVEPVSENIEPSMVECKSEMFEDTSEIGEHTVEPMSETIEPEMAVSVEPTVESVSENIEPKVVECKTEMIEHTPEIVEFTVEPMAETAEPNCEMFEAKLEADEPTQETMESIPPPWTGSSELGTDLLTSETVPPPPLSTVNECKYY